MEAQLRSIKGTIDVLPDDYDSGKIKCTKKKRKSIKGDKGGRMGEQIHEGEGKRKRHYLVSSTGAEQISRRE